MPIAFHYLQEETDIMQRSGKGIMAIIIRIQSYASGVISYNHKCQARILSDYWAVTDAYFDEYTHGLDESCSATALPRFQTTCRKRTSLDAYSQSLPRFGTTVLM